jgi:hypothetical protein
MNKECDRQFPPWTDEHELAFNGIKKLVVSHECLTVIDHENLGENKIYVVGPGPHIQAERRET